MKVFVGISHKGGTGRSVTIANLAYRFAIRAHNVCIVDFDLASPTMGAVLDLTGLEAGVSDPSSGFPLSVGDLLENNQKAGQAEKAIVSVWSSPTLNSSYAPNYGRFSLIPGLRQLGDRIAPDDIAKRIPHILDALSRNYDTVFLDVRSGASNVLSAISSACVSERTHGRELISSWLFHFRWTQQHLIGIADLLSNEIEGLRRKIENDDRICLIRTAFINPETIGEPARAWFLKRHADLEKSLKNNIPESIMPLLGDIPLDPILQWRECIITPDLVKNGVANEATDRAFSLITDKLLERYYNG